MTHNETRLELMRSKFLKENPNHPIANTLTKIRKKTKLQGKWLARRMSIIQEYNTGKSSREVAEMFKISRARVHQVMKTDPTYQPHYGTGRGKSLGMVRFLCDNCTKENHVRKHLATFYKSNHHFCSMACFVAWKKVNIKAMSIEEIRRRRREYHKIWWARNKGSQHLKDKVRYWNKRALARRKERTAERLAEIRAKYPDLKELFYNKLKNSK